jgi:hypothetical protein
MAATQIKTAPETKAAHSNFMGKAQQFYGSMLLCYQDQEWDSVFLLGVHAAISAADSLCVFKVQKRSIGSSHQDAVKLLMECFSQDAESKKNTGRLAQIINQKHLAEYEARRFTQKEAAEFIKQVERFMTWAKGKLPV